MNRGRIAAGVVFAIIGVIPVSSMAAESPASTEKIAKAAQETIEAAKQYAAQQKEAFQRKAHEELAGIQWEISGLRGVITDASESTRVELQKAINELEKKKDGVKETLEELRRSTDATWHEVREEMNTALNELKHSYHKLQPHMP